MGEGAGAEGEKRLVCPGPEGVRSGGDRWDAGSPSPHREVHVGVLGWFSRSILRNQPTNPLLPFVPFGKGWFTSIFRSAASAGLIRHLFKIPGDPE